MTNITNVILVSLYSLRFYCTYIFYLLSLLVSYLSAAHVADTTKSMCTLPRPHPRRRLIVVLFDWRQLTMLSHLDVVEVEEPGVDLRVRWSMHSGGRNGTIRACLIQALVVSLIVVE